MRAFSCSFVGPGRGASPLRLKSSEGKPSSGRAGPQRIFIMAVSLVGAQIAEELVDLTRQDFRRRGQVAGRREHRGRGLVGLADRLAERTDVGDQGLVALGG